MPQLALISCIVFVVYLFRKERKAGNGLTPQLWIPLIWMFLAGSRYVSQWLSLRGPMISVDAYSEGSPVDRVVFFSLIAIGVAILSRRHLDWGILLYDNKWLALYFLYCLSSL